MQVIVSLNPNTVHLIGILRSAERGRPARNSHQENAAVENQRLQPDFAGGTPALRRKPGSAWVSRLRHACPHQKFNLDDTCRLKRYLKQQIIRSFAGF